MCDVYVLQLDSIGVSKIDIILASVITLLHEVYYKPA